MDDVALTIDRAAVDDFLTRNDIPGLVDIHTHFMPQNVLDKVWQYFATPREGLPEWAITYKGTEAERTATLRSLRVERFTSMLYPHRPEMAGWLNAWSAEFAAAHPDCAHTSTFFAEERAAEDVRAALESGAEVFKCHVQVGAFDPTDPYLDKVWGQLAEAGVPVVTHCGSGPEPGPHTGDEPIRQVLSRHPNLTLVIAHMGLTEYEAFLEMAEMHPNVHLDTTMSFTDFSERTNPYPRDLLPRLAAIGDKVVLGSDYPNIPYRYPHQLEALERLELGSAWLRAVCWDNGQRLIGAQA